MARYCGLPKSFVKLFVGAAACTAVVCLLFPAQPVAGEGGGRFLALCVGLKYPGTRDALQYSTDDVRKIADAFRRTSGFDTERSPIEALVDDEFDSPKPTVREVIRSLGAMAAEAGPEDRLVFYFSDHGLLGKNNHSILVCAGGSDYRDDTGHLYLSQVRNILSSSAAAVKLVIIDACHSGGKSADSGGLTPDSVALSLGGTGGTGGTGGGDQSLVWLVSSGADEKSWEDTDSGQGLFTRYLLECLGPAGELADVNYDGILSLSEIHQHVTSGIAAFLREKTFGRDPVWRGRRQTPRVGAGGATDADATTLARIKLFYYDQNLDVDSAYQRAEAHLRAKEFEKAFAEFCLAAEAGNAMAEAVLGRMRYEGLGCEKDLKKGIELLRRAAEAGNAEAQYVMGEAHFSGLGAPLDFKAAEGWFIRAMEQQHPMATYRLAKHFEFKPSRNTGMVEAATYFEKAKNLGALEYALESAKRGFPLAHTFLGHCYDDGEIVGKDEREALKWYKIAAAQGNAVAQTALGAKLTSSNSGVIALDYAEGLKWLNLAAEQGYYRAQWCIGDVYNYGKGVAPNQAEAIKWYRQSAMQGDPSRQNLLAFYFGTGVGAIKKDNAEQVKWYLRSAENGSAPNSILGHAYHKGIGVEKDYAEAVKWYRLAAENGYHGAFSGIGDCFATGGKGLPQDRTEAVKWYRQGADLAASRELLKL